MNSSHLAIGTALLVVSLAVAEPKGAEATPPKPEKATKESPQKKAPPKKASPTVKPQPSRKDLALKEARSCDRDKNGKIEGLETMTLNNLYKSNPDSFLYLFDENGSHWLEDQEIAVINEAIKPHKK